MAQRRVVIGFNVRGRDLGSVVHAYDAAGNDGTDILTVTNTPPDTEDPSVTITSPTSGSTYSTSSTPISLAGTASDNVGLTSVSWSSNRGYNGSCSGTTNWNCSAITLLSGSNVITVSAYDAAGNDGTDVLSVTYDTSHRPIPFAYDLNANADYSYIFADHPAPYIIGNMDDGYFDLSLAGFDFKFYGTPVDNTRISTNGYLTFGSDGTAGDNVALPNADSPNAIVAPFWCDLNLSLAGSISWGLYGTAPNRQLVIEWYQVPSTAAGTETYSFEIILYESTDKIKFQYLDVDSGSAYDHGSLATVGIENFDGTRASQYSFNAASLSNGQAIEFTPRRSMRSYRPLTR